MKYSAEVQVSNDLRVVVEVQDHEAPAQVVIAAALLQAPDGVRSVRITKIVPLDG